MAGAILKDIADWGVQNGMGHGWAQHLRDTAAVLNSPAKLRDTADRVERMQRENEELYNAERAAIR